jgi:mutual gliding-motility protein MglA
MVELNHRDRQIKVKIVYYGPPVGGKTTNLQVLHQHAETARRGEMISINSAQDRTILFDLLPLRSAGFRGFDLRLQILAVPGQAMYATTRRLVLKNADSLVFVANSAVDRWEENLQSFREMTQNLLAHRLDPATMPLVFQYNKRDLPQVMDIDFMDRALNARKVDSIPAVAVRGEGVLETFSAILMRTIQDLAKRYAILETTKGQPAWQWTQQAVVSMFGTSTLGPEGSAAGEAAPSSSPTLSMPAEPVSQPPIVVQTNIVPTGAVKIPSVGPSAVPPAAAARAPAFDPVPAPAVRPAPSPAPPPPPARPAVAPAAPSAYGVPPPAPAARPVSPTPAAAVPLATPAPPVGVPSGARAAPPEAPPLPTAPAAPRAPAPPVVAPPRPARKADTRPLHTIVRVAPQVVSGQEEAGRTGAVGPDARAQETLVESYAEASAQLGTALNDLREERDRSRGQVEDLEAMVAAAQEILSGKPLALTLAPVLTRLAAVGGVGHATFLVPEGPHRLRTAAVLGLAEDPLVSSPAAMRHTLVTAANDPKPRFHEAADNLDVGQALDRMDLPFVCALIVPVRTPRGVQGLFALYYTADAARPGEATLAHIGSMARVLTGALELSAALETVRGAERALEMALAGTASARGLEDVVSSLLELRERLALMRGRPGAPSWFVEEFAHLAPSLSTALQAGRSLLAFSKGEIQQDTIFLDELLGELGGDTAAIQIAPGAEAVWGDAALVRLALRTLVEQMSGASTGTLEIRATPAPGKVLLSVGVSGVAGGTAARPPTGPGLGLGVARRIAELHGGSLNAESVAGEGEWLVLALPAR